MVVVHFGVISASIMADSSKKLKQYNQIFLDSYSHEFKFMTKSRKGECYAFCSICVSDINIAHGGLNDIKKHVKSNKHICLSKSVGTSTSISTFFKKDEDVDAVTNAECLFTAFVVEHNLPMSVADHAGPLFRRMFPKCDIAKRYGCARTKTTAIIGAMADKSRNDVSEQLLNVPFAVATDGSNDSDSKLYPIVVTYFDSNASKILNVLLSVPILSTAATGVNIGNLVLNALQSHGLCIKNCIAFGADNAHVMIGVKNGAATVLLKEHKEMFVAGCSCHLIHLAAEKGAKVLPVAVDEILIDIYYYLEKSSKRKDQLKEIQEKWDVESHKILKHVCTRWLSLGRSLKRLLEQWDPLSSFFKEQIKNSKTKISDSLCDYTIPKATGSKNIKKMLPLKRTVLSNQPAKKRKLENAEKPKNDQSTSPFLTREERLLMFLSSDVNKAYCLFLDFIIPIFEAKTVVLQSSAPQIHILKSLLNDFLKELLLKFVKPNSIKDSKSLLDVPYAKEIHQKEDQDLVIGSAARNVVEKLKPAEKSSFYDSVKKYFTSCCNYILHKFPLRSELLDHAQVADISKLDKRQFSDVLFFVKKFPCILSSDNSDSEIDKLESEFCNIQVEDIPENILKVDKIDEQWVLIGNMKAVDGSYKSLASVMLSILTIPHSNAECERIFSQVKKTRTEFRSTLSNAQLENLLIIKSNQKSPCFEQLYDKDFLQKAKSATSINLKKK